MPPILSLPIYKTPTWIIRTDGEGHLQINHDVLKQIEQLDGPLVCVAVVGLHRSGKSYLLNRLAWGHGGMGGRQPGFPLGSTVEPKTKGIWVWARQHPLHQDRYVLLLDTEGLGDVYEGDPDYGNWIFCLATLLSSALCYNAKDSIDDDSLRKLTFITEMSKHIQTKTRSPSGNGFFFPHLVYVIRDFCADLVKDGRVLTEDEYLEEVLAIKPLGESKREEDCNTPRVMIKKYFPHRKCFVFYFPVVSPSLLKTLDAIDDDQLSKAFLQQVERFCDYIFRHAPVKTFESGQPINGRVWSSLLKTFVESIRNKCVPCVEDAVRSVITIEDSRLSEECVAMYRNRMLAGIKGSVGRFCEKGDI